MKNEIKEILEQFNKIFNMNIEENETTINFSVNECKQILNYITNLQEENERLKEYRESYRKELDFWKIQFSNLQDKIDKATEVLESMLPICIMPNNMLIHGTETAKTIEKAINILKGKSDE